MAGAGFGVALGGLAGSDAVAHVGQEGVADAVAGEGAVAGEAAAIGEGIADAAVEEGAVAGAAAAVEEGAGAMGVAAAGAAEAGPAQGPGGEPGDAWEDEINNLRGRRRALRAELALAVREERNTKRRRARVLQKAGNLSPTELLYLLGRKGGNGGGAGGHGDGPGGAAGGGMGGAGLVA